MGNSPAMVDEYQSGRVFSLKSWKLGEVPFNALVTTLRMLAKIANFVSFA